MRKNHLALGLAVAAIIAGSAVAEEPVVCEKPTRVTLTLKDKTRLIGRLVRLDEEKLVLDAAGEERTVETGRIDPVSLYMARRQVMDLSKAEVHVELGRFCQLCRKTPSGLM